jgi:hypothetical protein
VTPIRLLRLLPPTPAVYNGHRNHHAVFLKWVASTNDETTSIQAAAKPRRQMNDIQLAEQILNFIFFFDIGE